MRNRWVCLILAAGMFLWGARVCPAQQEAGSRNVFLQTIGLLAGQGLVLGYTNLEGIAARYEKHQLPKDKTLTLLAAAQRYTELTLSAFSDHLMGQLTEGEQKDLKLLIGYYETQRGAITALVDFVRLGGAKHRQVFEEMQERIAAIIRQISLTHAAPEPTK